MAVVFQQKKKIQKYLIIVFALVLLAAAGTFWYGFRGKESGLGKNEEGFLSERVSQTVKINFEALKDPLLEKLEPFRGFKPFEGQAGRENPFIPY